MTDDIRRRRTAPEPEHVTLTEAAEWLRCSTRTLERLIADGSGPPVIRISERRLIFRVADLRKWLAGRTREPADPPPMAKTDDILRAQAQEIERLKLEKLDAEMARGALQAIHELLDSGGVPRGTFADDHVRNLVAMYNNLKAERDASG
jgi:Helix-turn-helix domain